MSTGMLDLLTISWRGVGCAAYFETIRLFAMSYGRRRLRHGSRAVSERSIGYATDFAYRWEGSDSTKARCTFLGCSLDQPAPRL